MTVVDIGGMTVNPIILMIPIILLGVFGGGVAGVYFFGPTVIPAIAGLFVSKPNNKSGEEVTSRQITAVDVGIMDLVIWQIKWIIASVMIGFFPVLIIIGLSVIMGASAVL